MWLCMWLYVRGGWAVFSMDKREKRFMHPNYWKHHVDLENEEEPSHEASVPPNEVDWKKKIISPECQRGSTPE